MTGTVWLIRYAEVFLKSDPVRRNWERVLAHAIRRRMPGVSVQIERGRLWATGPVDPDRLRKVFGIASFSEAVFAPLDALESAALAYAEEHGIGGAATFAVRVKRSGRHAFRSPEKAAELGAALLAAHPGLRVDLDHPGFEVFVEIRGDRCYLYHEVVPGQGGLPERVQGTLVALLSAGIDSPVAAYLMMRRGCRVVPLYVALAPSPDEDALAKARATAGVLREFDPDLELVVVTDDYLARARGLMRRDEERLTCVICKRRMYRLAAALAGEVGALGIVTGESLGQVASQTLENLAVLDRAAAIPVHRPLIGFDKEEIIAIARRIGTFAPAIAPDAGCAAVPRVPTTRAVLDEVEALEARVEQAGLGREE
ncbi:MAG: tRNA 4-thiouridine(8) synthase ThiI [Methanospirillum sp.]|nr:tRNA 4-thiouridine(8) synthase ThiI [Methanospirillum sp.]